MSQPKSYIDESGDARELDEVWFRKAKRGRPALPSDKRKKRVNLTLDRDVIDRLKATGNMSGEANDILRDKLGMNSPA